jgi:hypothetical protein
MIEWTIGDLKDFFFKTIYGQMRLTLIFIVFMFFLSFFFS